MSPFTNPDVDNIRPGDRIKTACGGMSLYTPGTVSVVYNGKPVYFCLPACKKDFERDPLSSCLALSIADYE